MEEESSLDCIGVCCVCVCVCVFVCVVCVCVRLCCVCESSPDCIGQAGLVRKVQRDALD